jgi:nicotinate phosphoribosyltransferase
MKLSHQKVTFPGRKQVFRIQDRKGNFIKDILALDDEKIKGKPLLIKVCDKGKIVYNSPDLNTIRKRLADDFKRFPKGIREIFVKYKYPVLVSPGLKKLKENLTRQLSKRQ